MVNKIIKKVKAFSKKVSEDSLAAYAAQTTFFVLLSFFPFIMLLVMIASKFSLARTNVVFYLLDVAPDQFKSYILYIVDEIMFSDSNSFTIITALVSLWSAGKGIQALTYGLDKIYEVEQRKNFFITRLTSAIYTLIFMLLCLIIMVVHVFGKQIGIQIIERKPELANATILILSLKSAFTFVIIFFFLLLIYYQLPGRKGRVKHEVIGAALAALAWMLMTKIFSFYIQHISSVSRMYGSLTSIILIIIWLYIGMQIILYGAEINYQISSYIEEYRMREGMCDEGEDS